MTGLLSRTSIIVLSMVLTGCANIMPGQEKASSISRDALPAVPVNWEALAARVGPVRVGWIFDFNDPTLNRMVTEAQANNRDLQAAAANVERSWALAKQAGATLKPNVGLSANGQSSGDFNGNGSNSSFNVGLQASWELDVWGRVRSGQQAAAASSEAAEADYRYTQQSLAAGVARSYFLAIEAEQQQHVAADVVTALRETSRIVQVQFDNGAASAQDVSLAKTDLASAEDSLAAALGGKRDAIRALELLLGRYPGADLNVGATLPLLPEEPPAGLPADILERRPDLIAAERRIAAAIDGVDQAKAARLPKISLTASTGGASNELGNILNPSNLAWSLASNLLVPIFDGGAGEAQVEVNTADQKAAVASYAQAALTAFGEVESSLDQGQILKRRRIALVQARSEAENALRLANLRYSEGETDLVEVLTIQQRVAGASSNLLSIERSQLDQYVDLNLALGGDWNAR